jgi:hypothetical protein
MEAEDAQGIFHVIKELRIIEAQLLSKLRESESNYREEKKLLKNLIMHQQLITQQLEELFSRYEDRITR